MSMQSFRFKRLVDKKLTFGRGGREWEKRAHLEKPTNMKKLMNNEVK